MARPSLALLIALAACTPVAGQVGQGSEQAANGPILVRSAPADGATVREPRALILEFRRPVRLVELVVAGPAGEMPTMVASAGEQTLYSIPLSGLEPGRYEVRWRAREDGGIPHEGRLDFTVR